MPFPEEEMSPRFGERPRCEPMMSHVSLRYDLHNKQAVTPSSFKIFRRLTALSDGSQRLTGQNL